MRIKELRKQRGISQDELGKVLGVSRSAICQYEQGGRIPNYKSVVAMADYFNVTVDFLLDRDINRVLIEKNVELDETEKDLFERLAKLTDGEIEVLSKFVDFLISSRQ